MNLLDITARIDALSNTALAHSFALLCVGETPPANHCRALTTLGLATVHSRVNTGCGSVITWKPSRAALMAVRAKGVQT